MSPGDLYAAGVARFIALIDGVPDHMPVPATPPWRVIDVVAHLTGVCADLVNGNVDEWADPAWTAAQVDGRRGRSRDDLVAEWRALVPAATSVVADPSSVGLDIAFQRMPMVDVIAHEDDVREACGRERPIEQAEWDIIGAHRRLRFDDLLAELGLPPLRIVTPEGDDWVVGAVGGASVPAGEVRLSRQELWRSTTGRRARAAVRAYGWTVDPEPYLPAWAGGTFKYPED